MIGWSIWDEIRYLNQLKTFENHGQLLFKPPPCLCPGNIQEADEGIKGASSLTTAASEASPITASRLSMNHQVCIRSESSYPERGKGMYQKLKTTIS
jgi:hypothetical protein